MQNKYQKIPYGEANFDALRSEDYLYVDKTRFIEVLESLPKYQFFIRPRRFGKSLFISMLESYYDVNKKDKFEPLFGDLYIGKNPTPNRNDFLTLMFSFAGIVTNLGKDKLIESFNGEIIIKTLGFISRYSSFLKVDTLPKEFWTADKAIKFVMDKIKENNLKIFIFIDEYDNFANDLISVNDEQLYKDLLQGEGFVRTFYKTLKETTQQVNTRLFMTGVSPIMLDDMASGFNITTNLTTHHDLNEILGFNHDEVMELLHKYNFHNLDIDKIITDLKFYYNGYLFSENCKTKLYNSDMILYFLLSFKDGQYPKPILDENVRTDYRKIQRLASLFEDAASVDFIIESNSVEAELASRFPLEKMYHDKNNFLSLLFYMGMLTISGAYKNKVYLSIPNYVIKSIYWEYFQDFLNTNVSIDRRKLDGIMTEMQQKGNIVPFLDYVNEIMKKLSNRDLMKFNEKYIKTIMFTLFFIDGLYINFSEMEVADGYMDILLVKDQRYAQYVNYEWLIELKYLKASQKKMLANVRQQGKEQLERYAPDAAARERITPSGFKKALVTFIGKSKYQLDIF